MRLFGQPTLDCASFYDPGNDDVPFPYPPPNETLTSCRWVCCVCVLCACVCLCVRVSPLLMAWEWMDLSIESIKSIDQHIPQTAAPTAPAPVRRPRWR
jgi:hypothetical protein